MSEYANQIKADTTEVTLHWRIDGDGFAHLSGTSVVDLLNAVGREDVATEIALMTMAVEQVGQVIGEIEEAEQEAEKRAKWNAPSWWRW